MYKIIDTHDLNKSYFLRTLHVLILNPKNKERRTVFRNGHRCICFRYRSCSALRALRIFRFGSISVERKNNGSVPVAHPAFEKVSPRSVHSFCSRCWTLLFVMVSSQSQERKEMPKLQRLYGYAVKKVSRIV